LSEPPLLGVLRLTNSCSAHTCFFPSYFFVWYLPVGFFCVKKPHFFFPRSIAFLFFRASRQVLNLFSRNLFSPTPFSSRTGTGFQILFPHVFSFFFSGRPFPSSPHLIFFFPKFWFTDRPISFGVAVPLVFYSVPSGLPTSFRGYPQNAGEVPHFRESSFGTVFLHSWRFRFSPT